MSLVHNSSIIAALVASTGLVGLGQDRPAQQPRPTPGFAGPAIPVPPEQGRPWTPPETKLPRFLARATPLLFEQGVADPRGCEYREVDVGDGTLLTTHAFVLPARPGDAGRFAVGWDGVVYPAYRVGDAADLVADIRALAGTIKDRRTKATTKEGGPRVGAGWTEGFTGLSLPMFRAMSEKGTGPASVETASALKVCLLLRLGHADLAELLFAGGTTWTPEVRPPDLTDYHLSYLTLAREWADRLFNRAVDAHHRGDDAVALDAARRVASFVAQAGPALEKMGVPPSGNALQPGEAPSYFPKLGQLRELLADQERRAREPSRGPIPGPDAPAAERVAALIRDLDQVAGGMGRIMNGMTSPSGSDTEKALVLEGDAAVEPLLAALESDDRLTRTISYPGSRHGQDDRLIHHVFQVEQSALIGILKTRVIPGVTNFGWSNDRAARHGAAVALRAYWEKNRGVPELERYYRTLADDRATAEQWLDAAEALVQPSRPSVRAGAAPSTTPYRVGGKIPPPRARVVQAPRRPGRLSSDREAGRLDRPDRVGRGLVPGGRATSSRFTTLTAWPPSSPSGTRRAPCRPSRPASRAPRRSSGRRRPATSRGGASGPLSPG